MAISGDTYCTSSWTGFIINLKHNEEQYFAINAGLFIVDSFTLSLIYLQLVILFTTVGTPNLLYFNDYLEQNMFY